MASIKFHFEAFDWMSLFGCIFILFVQFNSFIALASEKSTSTSVVGERKYGIFSSYWAWLRLSNQTLEIVAWWPIPKLHSSIIPTSHKHSILIYCHRVYNRVMTWNISQELAIWAFPHFYIVGGCSCECILLRMLNHCSNWFFMICECFHAFSCSYIP